MTDKKVIYGVQYLRGLAALGVMLCHYSVPIKGYNTFVGILVYGQRGVHVFFLISGFIIVTSLNKSNYRPTQFFQFLIKRSIRIDPTYFITIILTLLLYNFLPPMPLYAVSAIPIIPEQLIAHFLYIVPFTKYHFYNHVFWTLCVEFQFYLLIGLFYFLVDSRIYRNLFLLLFCATCIIKFEIADYLVFTYAPIFCLGISLVDWYDDRKPAKLVLPMIFLLAAYYRFGIGVVTLSLASCLAIVFVDFYSKSLFVLGKISYSLYLIHSLTFLVVVGILHRLHIDLANNQLLWLFLEVVVALAFSMLYYRYVEKPSIELSKRIFYNGR